VVLLYIDTRPIFTYIYIAADKKGLAFASILLTKLSLYDLVLMVRDVTFFESTKTPVVARSRPNSTVSKVFSNIFRRH
jgi:hypothetical protein